MGQAKKGLFKGFIMTKEDLWRASLAQIQFNISPASFATWFRNTEIVDTKNGELVISVPNTFSKEWLSSKYHKLILKTIKDLEPQIKDIKFEVIKQGIKVKPASPRLEMDQLEFQQFKTDKETNLNPRYVFETFVVGPFNALSHAASQAVCKAPGSAYNPLFIYGGVGLGKTHLLQAIGNEIVKNYQNKKVRYLSSEKFTTDVVNSIRNSEVERFKSAYKDVDVLIIDDIQFIAGKEKTQEEFFHIFNSLYEKNKQVILSSDRPPNCISALEERLRSRFEGGMITDISAPDYETRVAILKNKIQERKGNIPSSVVEYIASNIKQNIRELEGALNQIMVYQKMNKCTIDEEKAAILLKNIISSPYKKINHKKIIKDVAEFYDLKEADLLCVSRKKEVVKPRQIAMYLIREELKGSFPFIGRKFGGRDHTTAIYACEKIAKEKENNQKLKEELGLLKEIIYKV